MKIALKTPIWWIVPLAVEVYATLHMNLSRHNDEGPALWGAPCIPRGTPGLVLSVMDCMFSKSGVPIHRPVHSRINDRHPTPIIGEPAQKLSATLRATLDRKWSVQLRQLSQFTVATSLWKQIAMQHGEPPAPHSLGYAPGAAFSVFVSGVSSCPLPEV